MDGSLTAYVEEGSPHDASNDGAKVSSVADRAIAWQCAFSRGTGISLLTRQYSYGVHSEMGGDVSTGNW